MLYSGRSCTVILPVIDRNGKKIKGLIVQFFGENPLNILNIWRKCYQELNTKNYLSKKFLSSPLATCGGGWSLNIFFP